MVVRTPLLGIPSRLFFFFYYGRTQEGDTLTLIIRYARIYAIGVVYFFNRTYLSPKIGKRIRMEEIQIKLIVTFLVPSLWSTFHKLPSPFIRIISNPQLSLIF